MKNKILFVLAMSFMIGSVHAYDEDVHTSEIKTPTVEYGDLIEKGSKDWEKELVPYDNPLHYQNVRRSDELVNRAMDLRTRRYLRRKYFDYNTQHEERIAHQRNKMDSNVDERQTFMSREGEFKYVPDYMYRRHSTNTTLTPRMNWKANFRNRAVQYYVDGDCPDVENGCVGQPDPRYEGLIYGSEHRAKRFPTYEKTAAYKAGITQDVRDAQKWEMSFPFDPVPTGYQKTTQRKNAFSQYFVRPDLIDEEWLERMFGKKMIQWDNTDFIYSTEAE